MKEAGIELMKNTKSVKDIDVSGKRVLIRVDFNVPMDEDFDISDDTRTVSYTHLTLPTNSLV